MAFPNDAQQAIINHLSGAILVTAPAGTGKTRVLVERVCRAVEKEIADPRRILCLTFTNRAAEEMRKTLFAQADDWGREVTIKTFHALCAQMLHAEARDIGLPVDFVIYDEEDCKELVAEVFNVNERVRDPKERHKQVQDYYGRLNDAKVEARLEDLSVDVAGLAVAKRLAAVFTSPDLARCAQAYQQTLFNQHALDFGDLVFYTRAMLACMPEIRQRWQNRFDFIQVDEMQDTHPSEYEIVRELARNSGNLAMIGDLAQTIYSWRGSKPDQVVAQFKRDFDPKPLSLAENYRATRVLLKAADSFAQNCDGFDGRYTPLIPASDCEQGSNVETARRPTEVDEAKWIGHRLLSLQREAASLPGPDGRQDGAPFAFGRAAILTRTNSHARVVHDALRGTFGAKIPCVTIEQYDFFRRKEVKDALAYLRLLINPHDASSMRRIHIHGAGLATTNDIACRGDLCGLCLTDFADQRSLSDGDPYRLVLDQYENGSIVVFDTETTGLDPARDWVIEIAAQRIQRGQTVDRFHRFIKVDDVGESINIHHISNEELARKGEPARQVLGDFFTFAQGALLAGHNAGFDIKMVAANARRVGLEPPAIEWLDTFDSARRFILADNYRLGTLAELLNLPHTPNHRGDADVAATVDLLLHLVTLFRRHARVRAALTQHYRETFQPFARQISQWRAAMSTCRPAELLRRVIEESNLIASYPESERARRTENLNRLVCIFEDKDDPALHPETALRVLLEYTALARNTDQIAKTEDRVMICTVHQAKGLEFDYVFIAGAVDGEFPSFMAQRERKPETMLEEARLFYVAMTRARKRLFISHYQCKAGRYQENPSRYLQQIDPAYCTEG